MKKIRLLFNWSALILLLVAAISAQQVKSQTANQLWVGEYQYEYVESATAGGAVPVITYTVLISRRGDSLFAQFTADGYQSSDQYECTVETTGNQLRVYFLKDISEFKQRRFKPFKKGDLIASLSRKLIRGKPRFLYLVGSYEIVPRAVGAKYPVYFKKIK